MSNKLEKGKINYLLDLSYGSSAKGTVITALSIKETPEIIMASHSTSSSHTVMDRKTGLDFVFKVLPSATSVYKITDSYKPFIILSPSSGFEVEQLIKEVEYFNIPKERLIIPARAYVIEESHKQRELEAMGGKNHLGSTLSGQSQAFCDKVSRKKGYKLAGDYDEVREIATVLDYPKYSYFIQDMLDEGMTALCELPQGFPLSLNYSNEVGKSTYRDVNPLEVQSAIGLNVKYFGKVIGNMRLYPIRVSNRFTGNNPENVVLLVEKEDGTKQEVRAGDININYDVMNAISQRLVDGKSVRYSNDEKLYNILSIVSGLDGTSGTFESDMTEVSWDFLSYLLGENVSEITTLTKLPRRVAIPDNGLLSIKLVKKADMTIGINYLSVTFLNYDIEKRSTNQIKKCLQRLLSKEFPHIELLSIQDGKYIEDVEIL